MILKLEGVCIQFKCTSQVDFFNLIESLQYSLLGKVLAQNTQLEKLGSAVFPWIFIENFIGSLSTI